MTDQQKEMWNNFYLLWVKLSDVRIWHFLVGNQFWGCSAKIKEGGNKHHTPVKLYGDFKTFLKIACLMIINWTWLFPNPTAVRCKFPNLYNYHSDNSPISFLRGFPSPAPRSAVRGRITPRSPTKLLWIRVASVRRAPVLVFRTLP